MTFFVLIHQRSFYVLMPESMFLFSRRILSHLTGPTHKVGAKRSWACVEVLLLALLAQGNGTGFSDFPTHPYKASTLSEKKPVLGRFPFLLEQTVHWFGKAAAEEKRWEYHTGPPTEIRIPFNYYCFHLLNIAMWHKALCFKRKKWIVQD